MLERGAHTKNIPSNPIVVYHPHTLKHYSQYIQQQKNLILLVLRIILENVCVTRTRQNMILMLLYLNLTWSIIPVRGIV